MNDKSVKKVSLKAKVSKVSKLSPLTFVRGKLGRPFVCF